MTKHATIEYPDGLPETLPRKARSVGAAAEGRGRGSGAWGSMALRHEIERLHKHGFRANPALVEAVLRQVGEYAS